jgi:isopenicillin N synthase-like dioxygenase
MSQFSQSTTENGESVHYSKLLDQQDWTTKAGFADRLRRHGWGVIVIDDFDHFQTIEDWESIFSKVFSLPREMLEYAGLYRGEQGVSVGYRHDEERKFIECRMMTTNEPNPNYKTLDDYSRVVKAIYDLLCPIGAEILRGIAKSLGLDDRVFVELTDCAECGRLPLKKIKRKIKSTTASSKPAATAHSVGEGIDLDNKEAVSEDVLTVDEVLVPALSSSLLRICKYESDDSISNPSPSSSSASSSSSNPQTQLSSSEVHHGVKRRIAFGAHTDTSFLTLGLTASNPAIEMVDQEIYRWVSPEKSYPANSIMVFVGEFLQVLTKDRFLASVHRVGCVSSGARISCPLIIREHPDKEINFHDPRYQHPDGDDAISESNVPSFDGMTLKMIHKLLELKRKKCFERNGSVEGNWVLSSFPIARMPEEDEAHS